MERLLRDAERMAGYIEGSLDIESFADVADAIHIIQEEMDIAGTTAKEAANTIEGSLNMMKASWENLVVGMADENADMDTLMNNFVESVATAAENLLPRIEQTLAGIGTLIEKLSPVIAEALPVLVGTLLPTLISSGASLISSLIKGIVEALPELGKALLDAVTIILTDVFGVSEENAQKFSDGVTGAFTSIKSGFSKMVESAQTDGTTLNKVWTGIKEGFETVKKFFKEAFEDVSDFFEQCVEDINTEGTWLNETWTGIQEAVQAFFDYISALFTSISEAFTWCVEQINTEGTILNTIWETIKTYASTAWENIKIIISTAIDVITGIFQFFTSILKGDWSAAWDAIKGIAVSVWEAIKSVFTNNTNAISNIVSNAWNAIKSATSSIWDGIKSAISSAWDGITSKVSNAINGVKSAISSGLNAAKGVVSGALDAIKSKFSTIFESAKNIVSTAIEKIKSLFNISLKLDMKLPHISVSGGKAPWGIGGKGELPSFDVKWYKKAYDNAMVLSKPTIFGYSNGNFLGGGDGNGNEIVAGESHLMNMIGQTVESRTTVQNERVVSILIAILDAITDGNEDTIRAILADKTFSVGEREFARLVKTYA